LADVVFSPRAESDLLGIGEYTLRTWGPAQADLYLTEISGWCQRLAQNPSLGRACDGIRPGLRRSEQGKHVIFYRERVHGILVSRILHRSMQPERHPMDEEL
jgi:toxin ParE1/3/4